MFESLISKDLMKFANSGINLKEQSLSLHNSNPSVECLIAAGYASHQMEESKSLIKTLPDSVKTWVSIVIKAEEFGNECIVTDDQKLIVKRNSNSKTRQIVLKTPDNEKEIVSITGEGIDNAHFEICLGVDLVLFGRQVIEYAKGPKNSLNIFKMHNPNHVALGAIALAIHGKGM